MARAKESARSGSTASVAIVESGGIRRIDVRRRTSPDGPRKRTIWGLSGTATTRCRKDPPATSLTRRGRPIRRPVIASFRPELACRMSYAATAVSTGAPGILEGLGEGQ